MNKTKENKDLKKFLVAHLLFEDALKTQLKQSLEVFSEYETDFLKELSKLKGESFIIGQETLENGILFKLIKTLKILSLTYKN